MADLRFFYLVLAQIFTYLSHGILRDSEAVSVMLMNASRYVAKQLVERMKEHFPNSEQFELKEEQLPSQSESCQALGCHHRQASRNRAVLNPVCQVLSPGLQTFLILP